MHDGIGGLGPRVAHWRWLSLLLVAIVGLGEEARAQQAMSGSGRPASARLVDTPFKKAPRPIIGAMRVPRESLPQIENFQLMGYSPLPNPGGTIARGLNGPIGISG